MDFETFSRIVESARLNHPNWFEGEIEPVAYPEDLTHVENALGILLPDQYKQFITHYPGGYFAFTNIFSVRPDSDWYVLEKARVLKLGQGFLPISDDQAGGFYGYRVVDNTCECAIYYYYTMEKDGPRKSYSSLYEFLISVGLQDAQ